LDRAADLLEDENRAADLLEERTAAKLLDRPVDCPAELDHDNHHSPESRWARTTA
jgi:hypothetical protein